ncbi:hypothetical protein [Dokdonia sp. Dokd-P16]|uniref:hypothetical protein n=1 Tax=Dokdonia sp. Dokd-P16 TaxID=2173169 RepID=UPI0013A5371A|nr:hypothetical protein [Dokdonia sp. Dokd-P16]
MQFSLRKAGKYLPLITLGLVVLNILSVYLGRHVYLFRYMPLVTVLCFLVYYIIKAPRIKFIVIAILVMLALREYSVFYYYKDFGQIAYILLGCVTYSLIIIKRLDMLNAFLKDRVAILLTLVFIGLNMIILNELVSQVKEGYEGSFQSGLVFLFGVIISLLGAIAVLYNQVINSDRSLAFLFFVFCFIFSDVASLLGYYFGINFFYYIDFVSAALGLAFFLYTVLDVDNKEEEKNQLTQLY